MTSTTPSPNYGPTPDRLFAGCRCIKAAGNFDGFVGEVVAEVQTAVMARIGDIDRLTDDQLGERLNGITADILERRLMPDFKREIRQTIDAEIDAELELRPLCNDSEIDQSVEAAEKRYMALFDLRMNALQRAILERNPFGPTHPDTPDTPDSPEDMDD